jgi:hypothetical protein
MEVSMGTGASWEFQSVPIDFEVFKALTARLKSPADTYNNVLRRELKLGETAITAVDSASPGRPWLVEGVTFPSGTEFRARYKRGTHVGRVEDGALVVNGERFTSPSPAAIAITGNSVNGWKFWECRRPGQTTWIGIDTLRKK